MTGIVASDVEVANKACVLVGLDPVTSFTQANSTTADFFFECYELLVQSRLEEHYWRWAMATYALTYIDSSTTTKWDGRFVKPNDALAIKSLHVAGNEILPIEFDTFDDEVHCNMDDTATLYAVTVRRVTEAYWPAMFVRAMALDLAGQLAGSAIMERPRMAKKLLDEANDLFVMGKSIQGMSRTTENIRNNRFANARKGRAGSLM